VSSDQTKLYALYTTAPYHVARAIAIRIAMDEGHPAELNETPDEAVVAVPPRRPHWSPWRWWSVILVLVLSPFAFRLLPPLTALQGFGMGWIAAAIVLLARREEWKTFLG
jgi:hypothetical protein